ncbi:unnamed protein product [Rodentolepis nana]|uniref:Aminopeptidase n=1 Tax=Rodentolepis nana TaxID=102285 RepID=A0A158QIX9_RODNA|nr:unnamed protein product [Rodentolepis nana]
MSGDNKYTPGVETTKSKRSLVIILGILLGVVSILALVFLGTTLYYLLKYRTLSDANLDGHEDNPLDSTGTKGALVTRVKDVRLPYTVIPLHYDLRLQAFIDGVDVKNFKFTGSVRVRLLCREATDVFFVHAHNDLNVNQSLIRLVSENGMEDLIKQKEYDKARQWFKITTTERLQPTKIYYLSFDEFGAPLTISLRGWYLSTYEENKVTKYMATSQLQPTEARRVFPCWDEPAFKSVFEIKLVRKENFHSLSNMPLVRSQYLSDGWVEDSFKPTLNTSTYLLAFVVSQVTSISGLDAKGRNFTVWARPDLISAAQFALELGRKIISFFEDYFELDYPLEKTDMLAVPHFAAGAMENWGLLIFREATLIWDPISGIENAKQKVASVISHEIAHQWFGNLVTLDWWDDLWLNEGFATFVECIGVAHAEPSWNMDEAFAVQHVQKVLYVDSMSTTRPVFLPVSHPDEINESFDTISYSKGAAVLRMMEAFITPEIFRQGLKIYLSKHKFRNTKPIDLWSSIEEANKVSNNYIDVEAVMNNWIKQAGYPIVTVKRLGGNQFELTQQRFVVGSGRNDSVPKFNKLRTFSSLSLIFVSKSLRLPINVGDGEWYAINLRQTGFYRVNYDEENWRILTETLINNHQEIPRLMRAQLIDDSFRISK